MLFACGLSGYDFAMYHLFNHAFFKALLFLSAGSVIHALSDEQDLRKMGGLVNLLPLTYISILIGSLSLMGFPFLTGFYSKDGILELAYASYTPYGYFAFLLGIFSACFTALYSVRLLVLVFLTPPNAFRSSVLHIHEAPYLMSLSMIFLFLSSVVIGFFAHDMFVGLGTNFWSQSILILPEHFKADTEFLPWTIKLFPVALSLSMGLLFFIVSYNQLSILHISPTSYFKKISFFLNYKWFFDPIFNFFIVKPSFFISHRITFEILDRGFFEYFGPLGLAKVMRLLISVVHEVHRGYLLDYLSYFLTGILLFSFCFYFSLDVESIRDIIILCLIVFFFKKSKHNNEKKG